jgi:hypothetical protein
MIPLNDGMQRERWKRDKRRKGEQGDGKEVRSMEICPYGRDFGVIVLC